MDLTMRRLEYAVALADHGSFRRAAQACFISQPSLSVQIARLEDDLGVTLFERARGGVVPTPAGRHFVEGARQVLRDAHALAESTRRFDEPLAGDLRVGVIATIAPYFLPVVVSRVLRRHPRLRLYLHEEKTEPLLGRLERGELDVLILALEAELGDVATMSLFFDAFHVAARRGHPLLRPRRIPVERLAGEPLLLLDDGHCLRDQAIELCRPAGIRDAASFRATSLSTLVEMVAEGLGVTLLPEMAIAVERRGRRIDTRPIAGRTPGRTIALAWRRSSPLEPALREFGAALRQAWRAAAPGRRRRGPVRGGPAPDAGKRSTAPRKRSPT